MIIRWRLGSRRRIKCYYHHTREETLLRRRRIIPGKVIWQRRKSTLANQERGCIEGVLSRLKLLLGKQNVNTHIPTQNLPTPSGTIPTPPTPSQSLSEPPPLNTTATSKTLGSSSSASTIKHSSSILAMRTTHENSAISSARTTSWWHSIAWARARLVRYRKKYSCSNIGSS